MKKDNEIKVMSKGQKLAWLLIDEVIFYDGLSASRKPPAPGETLKRIMERKNISKEEIMDIKSDDFANVRVDFLPKNMV